MNDSARPHLVVLATGLALVLAGCASPAGMAPDRGVTAIATLAVQDLQGRRLLKSADLTPWVKADIDHVALALFQGADAAALANLTIPLADLDRTITFASLARNKTYKIEARAWADAGETTVIDDFAASAASCTTTFMTATDDQVDVGAIALKLRDKTFSGATGGSALAVTAGGVNDTTTAEGITVE